MMLCRFMLSAAAVLTAVRSAPAAVVSPASLFDPSRHMRVSEVRPGMKGYGLTVFHGSKIEKFDVIVVSILHNFNPKDDVVLIDCPGEFLKHTGAIAGMSGSPIFLRDDAGHDRLIGAFAYGWPLTKDPLAGVQPIEYMLELPTSRLVSPATPGTTTRPGESADQPVQPSPGRARLAWSLKDAGLLPFPGQASGALARRLEKSAGTQTSVLAGDARSLPRMRPLATPLMAGGFSSKLLADMGSALASDGLIPLQAGGSSGHGTPDAPAPKLEPGSVLAIPLLTGDSDLTAVGTCTEVIGDRIFGFGHSFNNEGVINLAVGSGEIQGIVPNLQTSFKLGSISANQGTLCTDGPVGVAGRLGASPPQVPLDFTVTYADGSAAREYHYLAALHPKLTPMIAGLAFSSALSGVSELPQYNTVDYSINLEFANGQTVKMTNRAVNAAPTDIFGEIGAAMTAASDNPFQRVLLSQVSGTMRVTPEERDAQILEINVPKSKYHPGDVVKAFVTYQPFRSGEATTAVELELPRDLAQGTYQLIVSDAERYFRDEVQSRPFRFTAANVNDVFSVLRDVASIRVNALYLRLLRQPDGVAIGRVAMPRLPSSRRQVFMGAGRSDTSPFISATLKTVPTDLVMTGSAEFAITIDTSSKVAVGGPRSAKAEPAAAPPLKLDEPKAKGAGAEPAAPKAAN